jgi:hypothetical protein
MTEITGQCLCGDVTVTLKPKKQHLGACHCDMCRRWTGSVFLAIHAAKGSLKSTGPVKTFRSSGWAERAWCDNCGSTLWFRLTIPGREHFGVAAGLFKNAAGMTLSNESYIDRKPSGFSFAGEHQRITEAEVKEIIADFMAEENA